MVPWARLVLLIQSRHSWAPFFLLLRNWLLRFEAFSFWFSFSFAFAYRTEALWNRLLLRHRTLLKDQLLIQTCFFNSTGPIQVHRRCQRPIALSPRTHPNHCLCLPLALLILRFSCGVDFDYKDCLCHLCSRLHVLQPAVCQSCFVSTTAICA